MLSVHLCLRTAYTTPGLCLPVVWFMSTNPLICYKLCMHLNWVTFESLHAVCMISDLTETGPATQKQASKVMGLMWLLATLPIEYGTIAKKKAGFTPFCAFCHVSLIDGKRLLCSHTLLSNYISPSCNLKAQRKFFCLFLFRAGTKVTTKTKVESWSQCNSNSSTCASHCFLD